ncbi:DUF402 domain-containing protein [Cuneatibacter caecimuris]|uniref:DUF402 domain-containing protein n=1 Tax=Cuneatibacter caecimuris TaxID=1796618 RepID=A0A4V2F5Y3_9FIRM|nr:DUF402 domain-containing protein [Cuneatibacter caecimuris]RZS94419.1 hypothetical protein EV209_2261 [Cuneatibacter caecimuris]
MEPLTLYRRRLIPNETVLLDHDELLFHDSTLLVTRWKTIHPKKRLSHGTSCYYLKRGYKVSQFFDHSGQLMYWYCDIIETSWDSDARAYTFTDLLADVVVCPDLSVHLLDLDELALALEDQLITPEQMCAALRRLHSLLQIIEAGEFSSLLEPFRQY